MTGAAGAREDGPRSVSKMRPAVAAVVRRWSCTTARRTGTGRHRLRQPIPSARPASLERQPTWAPCRTVDEPGPAHRLLAVSRRRHRATAATTLVAILFEERFFGESAAFADRLLHVFAEALEVPFRRFAQNGSLLDEVNHLAIGATRHLLLVPASRCKPSTHGTRFHGRELRMEFVHGRFHRSVVVRTVHPTKQGLKIDTRRRHFGAIMLRGNVSLASARSEEQRERCP
jgi:hypothetical protein